MVGGGFGAESAELVGVGKGRAVLLGFGAVHRGQPRGTFKLLFDAIYGSTLAPGGAPTQD